MAQRKQNRPLTVQNIATQRKKVEKIQAKLNAAKAKEKQLVNSFMTTYVNNYDPTMSQAMSQHANMIVEVQNKREKLEENRNKEKEILKQLNTQVKKLQKKLNSVAKPSIRFNNRDCEFIHSNIASNSYAPQKTKMQTYWEHPLRKIKKLLSRRQSPSSSK